MRQIKFRGVSKEELGWVYGNLADNLFGEPVIEDRIDPPPQSPLPIRSQRRTKIIPETVGEFIGVTDKNGKEIYEGDLIRVFVPPSKYASFTVGAPKHLAGHVEYSAESGRYLISFPKNDLHIVSVEFGWSENDFEVIGNIHEHPHLLAINTQDK